MEEKILTYETDEITVTYDVNRCIHAAECVKGLKSVFNPDRRPWIQPEHESVENVAEVVKRCPTGALKFKSNSDELEEETPAQVNTIAVSADGPVYFRGNIEVQSADGEVLLKDTRFALCRCGHSGNKPACDNTHSEIDFEAPGHFSRSNLTKGAEDDHEKLLLKVMEDGPLIVEGSYQIYSNATQPVSSSKNIALCRCGGSGNKPFCDGTHKEIGFEG
ncbi:MAG: CDGSH iron-sulfur domain-containing protein [Balneolaceae bacterium]|nr:CDGSH iron-sulfur domain-containing protein [Balneolaceae bacterium]